VFNRQNDRVRLDLSRGVDSQPTTRHELATDRDRHRAQVLFRANQDTFGNGVSRSSGQASLLTEGLIAGNVSATAITIAAVRSSG
jgi:hypothetical protein